MPKINANSIEAVHTYGDEIRLVLGSLIQMYSNASSDINNRYKQLGEKLTSVVDAIIALREIGQTDAAERLSDTITNIESAAKRDADGTYFDARKFFQLPVDTDDLPPEAKADLERRLTLVTANIVGIAKLLKGAV